MSEMLKIIIVFLVMMVIAFYARKYRMIQMVKARDIIIEDLKAKNAIDVDSAVKLDYAKSRLFKVGLRDDRPRVLKQLIQYGIVGMTEERAFYLHLSELKNLS